MEQRKSKVRHPAARPKNYELSKGDQCQHRGMSAPKVMALATHTSRVPVALCQRDELCHGQAGAQ